MFVGKIALMANVLICYNVMPTLNKVSCILYLVALSVLFQLCLFHFKLMLIHDGAVLAPAWIAGLNTAT